MRTLIDLLRSILGDDADLVARFDNAQPSEPASDNGYTDDENQALAALADITDEDLTEAIAALREAGQEAPADSLPALVDHARGLRFVLDARAAAETAEAEARATALAEMDALDTPPDADGDDEDLAGLEGLDGLSAEDIQALADAAPPASEDEAALAELDAAGLAGVTAEDMQALTEPEPEPVTAAPGPSISHMANRVPRPRRPLPTPESVEAAADGAKFVLAASAAGHREGDEIGYGELAEVFMDRFERMGKVAAGYSEDVVVASLPIQYEEDRRLGSDAEDNGRKIKAAVAGLWDQSLEANQAALTAGVCAPAMPIYEIAGIGVEATPVIGFLPSMQADRGGVTFRPGQPLSTIGAVNTTNSGVSVWTSANDDNPADPATKPVLTFSCPATETATVQSIAARLQATNMAGGYDPEAVGDLLRRQMIFHASVRENQALDFIENASTAIGPDVTNVIGFARHWLMAVNQAAVAIRNRERMQPDAQLDVLAPAWTVGAMQDDLSFEQPGAAQERLATTQAQVEEWLRVRNIRVGWFLDGDFTFAAQAVGANLVDYPQYNEFFMFEPGHHVHLAGRSLDLGIVRDSTLNDTNAYQTFSEIDETVASVGVVSYAIRINVCRTGTSGAGAEITCGGVS